MNNLLKQQYIGLIECNNEEISILANTSAFIMQNFNDISWAGFYLLKNEELILGPFQGLIACTLIPFDKFHLRKVYVVKRHQQEKLFLLKMFINLKDILPVTAKVIVKSLSH